MPQNDATNDSSVPLNIFPLWTVEDVARYLRIQPETVRNMARTGAISGIKLKKRWLFHKEDIDTFLKDNQLFPSHSLIS